MLFATQKSIESLQMRTHHLSKIAYGLKQVVGVSFDGLHIYWTDISQKTESIVRSLTNGSHKEVKLKIIILLYNRITEILKCFASGHTVSRS